MKRLIRAAALLLLATSCSVNMHVEPENPDQANFGAAEDQLFWNFDQKVAGFRNMDQITWARVVTSGDKVYELPRSDVNLDSLTFTYDDSEWSIDEYIERQKIAGLIVVKDGRVVYERYELGNTEASRWVSYSVAKSVTSLLVGAAIEDGYIVSVDEFVSSYLPRLKSSPYDGVTIRDLLQMSSGVDWAEAYADPESDLNKMTWATLDVYDYLRQKPRVADAGTVFNYNTAESNVVGDLVRSSVGNNLSTYLSEKIWKPFGMERDAFWVLTEPGGGEFGGSSLNATLRDYARIGLFALKNGQLADGSSVLPDHWMAESTTPSPNNKNYGYLWWLRGDGSYAASGIFGQQIYINTDKNIVIAMHSARDDASNTEDWRIMQAANAALVEATMKFGDDHE